MKFSEKIKEIRKMQNLTQEQFAEKIFISRNAVAKWESNRGYPDIQNLITISEVFEISLDDLIKNDKKLKTKIILDSASKKWHILVIIYLIAIISYIGYFHFAHKILMIGFLIATLFMLGFELRIFIKEKIWKNKS
jgi:transcriptional regulator with XRE-family HTH domain